MGPGPSESRTAGDVSPERTVWQDEQEHCYEQESYLGRDPAGPLAPLGGPEPLLHHAETSIDHHMAVIWWIIGVYKCLKKMNTDCTCKLCLLLDYGSAPPGSSGCLSM